MTTSVTDQLLRDLVVGSHAEGHHVPRRGGRHRARTPSPARGGHRAAKGSLSTFTLPSRLWTR
jgi:hypothetical protein